MDDELYRQQRERYRKEQLERHQDVIGTFREKCNELGVPHDQLKFDYLEKIGITAEAPNILTNLTPQIERDKDGLVKFASLLDFYSLSPVFEGSLIHSDHFALASPVFRRGMHPLNNWAPQFIRLFWFMNEPDIDAYIALDFDRVRIDVDGGMIGEYDTWFGASFNDDIRLIKDGTAKMRPAPDLDDNFLLFSFNDAYSLDIQWKTKGNIKSFYALEFKGKRTVIEKEGTEYHPARYLHAEFDLEKNHFRHFDGAIQYLTTSEYFERRETDFNHDKKGKTHIKPMSQKVFKLNGKVPIETWKEFCCHFCASNPLIYEYFAGEYPPLIQQAIDRYRD